MNDKTVYKLIAMVALLISAIILLISGISTRLHAYQIDYFKQGLANEQQKNADLQQQLIDAEHMIAELEYTKYK